MSPINVAIAGATGKLGVHVAKAFLGWKSDPKVIGRVLVLTRDATSPNALELQSDGAEIYAGAPASDVLKGIDVAVDIIKAEAGEDVHNAFAKAAADAGVKIYFPAEYGLDHTVPGARADCKAAYDKYARSLGGGMRVISVFAGSFIQNLDFGAMLGLDYEAGSYSAVGSADIRNTFTSPGDIAKSIVRLSLLAAENSSSVPEYVRISGDAKSYREIAEIVRKEKGQDSIKLDIIPTEEWMKTPESFVKDYRYRFSTGEVDFSSTNCNELVNPGEKHWNWETVEAWAKAKKGSFAPPSWGSH